MRDIHATFKEQSATAPPGRSDATRPGARGERPAGQGVGAIRVGVVICSVGRPDAVAELLPRLRAQTLPPTRIVLSVPSRGDAPADLPEGVEVVLSPKGLPAQRNRGMEAVRADCDVIAFYDDDFVPSRFSLEGLARTFAAHPGVDGLMGVVLADGIKGPGIGAEEAERAVDRWDGSHADPASRPAELVSPPLEGLYGCNMAYRASTIGSARFDERLPLYGWQEDIDFAAQMPGSRFKTAAVAGVHRGAKGGRETKGQRLGYSQIANPLYLWRKGTMSRRFMLRSCLRNLAANHLKMLRPEPWVDRRARAAGNRLAIAHALRGRVEPEHILKMD